MKRTAARRSYDSTLRREAAVATRQSILAAARRVFLEKGYASATMAAIAQGAGVALDTIYATVGKKPSLFRLLIETAISGIDSEVPAEARDYVRPIRAEADAAQKLRLYATALRSIQPRLAPLISLVQGAAPACRHRSDRSCCHL
jgi:AcrR family transcriptional regulator